MLCFIKFQIIGLTVFGSFHFWSSAVSKSIEGLFGTLELVSDCSLVVCPIGFDVSLGIFGGLWGNMYVVDFHWPDCVWIVLDLLFDCHSVVDLCKFNEISAELNNCLRFGFGGS